jgi:hypothetical protein
MKGNPMKIQEKRLPLQTFEQRSVFSTDACRIHAIKQKVGNFNCLPSKTQNESAWSIYTLRYVLNIRWDNSHRNKLKKGFKASIED